MRNLICYATTTLLLVSGVAHAESFVCIADLSSGFFWNGQGWQTSSFNVKDDRFVVERTNPATTLGYEFQVKRIGSKAVAHSCKQARLPDGSKGTRIFCGGMAVGFLMDTETLRFQQIYGFGFLDGKDSPSDTPNLTIGKCSRLN